MPTGPGNALNISQSGVVVFDGTNTFTGVPYSTSPGASTISEWDTNKNLSANSFITAYATTATAISTTTLTVASKQHQYFTGTNTQTVTLPQTSTLVLGQSFTIVNTSTGTVTVQSYGSNTIQAMAQNYQLVVTCINTGADTAAAWSAVYIPFAPSGGGVSTYFYAYLSSDQTSVTGNGAVFQPIFDTASLNAGSAYNTGTGYFTAPATGFYHFTAQVGVDNLSSLMTGGFLSFYFVNGLPQGVQYSQNFTGNFYAVSGSFITANGTVLNITSNVPLNSGDTASVRIQVANGASNAANVSANYSFFSGYRIA